jgi:hypothetical protein
MKLSLRTRNNLAAGLIFAPFECKWENKMYHGFNLYAKVNIKAISEASKTEQKPDIKDGWHFKVSPTRSGVALQNNGNRTVSQLNFLSAFEKIA